MSLLKPIILTSGDPSGIGPEITIEAWKELGKVTPFAVLGDLAQLLSFAKNSGIAAREIKHPHDVAADALCIINQNFRSPPRPGVEQPKNADGTIAMITRAVQYVKSGAASAMVTNPIHKNILIEGAGFLHPGHTEFLAELDGEKQSVMMLAAPDLKVVPVTIHIPLKDVALKLDAALLTKTIKILNQALIQDFGIETPKIAVAGLNPHAGESGQMGHEEIDLIMPTLEPLRAAGLDIMGPMSADTMFHAKARKNYDAAVCMYHDQALIPIKTIDFDRGVNITLGLSFVRTSPDHGTAYDIAGKSLANPSSLIEAIKMASNMAKNRAST